MHLVNSFITQIPYFHLTPVTLRQHFCCVCGASMSSHCACSNSCGSMPMLLSEPKQYGQRKALRSCEEVWVQ